MAEDSAHIHTSTHASALTHNYMDIHTRARARAILHDRFRRLMYFDTVNFTDFANSSKINFPLLSLT